MIRNALFSLGFLVGSIFYVLAAPLVAPFGRRAFSRHIIGWGRMHDWCARHLLGIRWRVEGTLPTGACLLAFKHEAMYETIEALVIFDRPAPIFKQELMRIPLWGWACQHYGGVPIEREAGAKAMRKMLADAKPVIAEGRPIMIFPEGTRVPHGQAPELKAGLAGLYRLLGLPLVPIACDSGKLIPRKGRKRPGVVTFRIGETIPPGLPRDEVEARVHAAINALNLPPA